MNLPADSKARKEIPIYSGLMKYFPKALAAVAHLSFVGNEQHNPGQPLHWNRKKSTDHGDCVGRHQLDAGTLDGDGERHSTKVAWRALAQLEVELEHAGSTRAENPKAVPVSYDGGNIENGDYAGGFEEVEARSLKAALTQKAQDEAKLVALGCSPKVAGHIVGGITYCGVQNAPYVYVAGPMRGLPEDNFPAFDAARDRFVQAGFNVISPADIDRAAGDKTTADQVTFAYRDVYCLFFLKLSTNGNGMIAVLPRFEKSSGTAGEFFFSRWIGLPILSAISGDKLTLMDVCEADLLTAFEDFIKGQ